jgi:glycerol transport system ATP-binding protein
MLAHGIHHLAEDETVEVFIDTRHLLVFDAGGRAVAAPDRLAA